MTSGRFFVDLKTNFFGEAAPGPIAYARCHKRVHSDRHHLLHRRGCGTGDHSGYRRNSSSSSYQRRIREMPSSLHHSIICAQVIDIPAMAARTRADRKQRTHHAQCRTSYFTVRNGRNDQSHRRNITIREFLKSNFLYFRFIQVLIKYGINVIIITYLEQYKFVDHFIQCRSKPPPPNLCP